MLRIPYLRNILLVALLFATIFPIYNYYYVVPSYQELLIKEAERDAARFVRFMIVSNFLDEIELHHNSIPEALKNDIFQLKEEEKLVKLRIFSPLGEIVFSTDEKEIGTVNKKRYFREIVAQGEFYSKIVKKESVTAEGVATDIDLVETYVPIMIDGHFHGAMEVYYDITVGQESISSLSRQSLTLLFVASSGLLLMTILLLFRAHNSIVARELAEIALKIANEELEHRVGQRTLDLSASNQLLAAEICERKKAQIAQKQAFISTSEARDRIDSIVSSVADALLVTDHNDSVLLINPAAEILFDIKAVNALGNRLQAIITNDDLLFKIEKARAEVGQAESVDFDFDLIKEETNRTYQVRTSRLMDTSVNERGLILLIHDVTRERQIDRMKSEFVSMAAHELQTPLTMILGYSELLLDLKKEFEPSEKREFLQIINDKSIELSSLIDNILDLSRIEDGHGLQLNFTPVNIVDLCRQVLDVYANENATHTFLTEFAFEDMSIDADEKRLSQVIYNLLGNAITFSPDGGEIKVVINKLENWICLDIIDQGIGMSAEECAHAFERFYRADSSNTAVRGTGLGLSITKYIVDAHGGEIDIYSRKGEGTRLEVRLPLAK